MTSQKTKQLLIIKNIDREGPGTLKQLLDENGLPYQEIINEDGTKLPDPTKFAAIAVLGGPDSANDETAKMKNEIEFVTKALEHNIPYIGICLGMQVMVKAAGGAVVKSPYKEVGFRDEDDQPYEVIMRTQEGKHDPLFHDMGEHFRVFQLHGETVNLTKHMDQLAIGRNVKNQIVKVGGKAYGIQCHFELTQNVFEVLIQKDPDLLKLNTTALRSEFTAIYEDYEKTGRTLFGNFLKIAELL